MHQRLNRLQLHHNIHAVAVVVYHLQHAVDLLPSFWSSGLTLPIWHIIYVNHTIARLRRQNGILRQRFARNNCLACIQIDRNITAG